MIKNKTDDQLTCLMYDCEYSISTFPGAGKIAEYLSLMREADNELRNRNRLRECRRDLKIISDPLEYPLAVRWLVRDKNRNNSTFFITAALNIGRYRNTELIS